MSGRWLPRRLAFFFLFSFCHKLTYIPEKSYRMCVDVQNDSKRPSSTRRGKLMASKDLRSHGEILSFQLSKYFCRT